MKLASIVIVCVLAFWIGPGNLLAQASPATPQEQTSPDALQKMAVATANMAQTCQLMMQREMHREATLRPLAIGVGTVLTALVVLALLLFVILEVQWIRLANFRIHRERQASAPA